MNRKHYYNLRRIFRVLDTLNKADLATPREYARLRALDERVKLRPTQPRPQQSLIWWFTVYRADTPERETIRRMRVKQIMKDHVKGGHYDASRGGYV